VTTDITTGFNTQRKGSFKRRYRSQPVIETKCNNGPLSKHTQVPHKLTAHRIHPFSTIINARSQRCTHNTGSSVTNYDST
jgi:hypothetical protein